MAFASKCRITAVSIAVRFGSSARSSNAALRSQRVPGQRRHPVPRHLGRFQPIRTDLVHPLQRASERRTRRLRRRPVQPLRLREPGALRRPQRRHQVARQRRVRAASGARDGGVQPLVRNLPNLRYLPSQHTHARQQHRLRRSQPTAWSNSAFGPRRASTPDRAGRYGIAGTTPGPRTRGTRRRPGSPRRARTPSSAARYTASPPTVLDAELCGDPLDHRSRWSSGSSGRNRPM